ncbi:hypothetical protein CHK_3193 [Christensenella hongkongensis]|uniref:Uncharacterized protein n=1 Tax=Christensenella hongkongensis TaxID=270498 RepID=A0A0M2NEE4_9FIRM|nr:hypothetical protein CHK_3193 [Christensenella hongkongensis]
MLKYTQSIAFHDGLVCAPAKKQKENEENVITGTVVLREIK